MFLVMGLVAVILALTASDFVPADMRRHAWSTIETLSDDVNATVRSATAGILDREPTTPTRVSESELCARGASFESFPADEIFAEAEDCMERGKPDLALLRYEVAYHKGNAEAARRIGDMYSSEHWDPSTSPFPSPNDDLAQIWYGRADDVENGPSR